MGSMGIIQLSLCGAPVAVSRNLATALVARADETCIREGGDKASVGRR